MCRQTRFTRLSVGTLWRAIDFISCGDFKTRLEESRFAEWASKAVQEPETLGIRTERPNEAGTLNSRHHTSALKGRVACSKQAISRRLIDIMISKDPAPESTLPADEANFRAAHCRCAQESATGLRRFVECGISSIDAESTDSLQSLLILTALSA
jgi:hypothetical protein